MMGFKCPYCLQDFGTNKLSWKAHIKNEHDGIGDECVKTITNTWENIGEEIKQGD